MATVQKTMAGPCRLARGGNSLTANKKAIPQSIAVATNLTGISSSDQSSKKLSEAQRRISAERAIEKRTTCGRRIFPFPRLTGLDRRRGLRRARLRGGATATNALHPGAISGQVDQFRDAMF